MYNDMAQRLSVLRQGGLEEDEDEKRRRMILAALGALGPMGVGLMAFGRQQPQQPQPQQPHPVVRVAQNVAKFAKTQPPMISPMAPNPFFFINMASALGAHFNLW